MQEPAVDAFLELCEVLRREPGECLNHLPAGGARSPVLLEHLIVETGIHLITGERGGGFFSRRIGR